MWRIYFKGDYDDSYAVTVSSEEEAKEIVAEYDFMEYRKA